MKKDFKVIDLDDNLELERLKKNDDRAFERLFRKYYSPLKKYANFYTRDERTAEDIVQDLFMKIWETRHNFVLTTSFKSYLYKSTHNNCIEYFRHLQVSQKYDLAKKYLLEEAQLMNRLFLEKGLSSLFEREIEELLSESLKKLPEKTREIFIMSRIKYMKNSEIAKHFDLSEKSVEYHISKVLLTLRTDLKDYLPVLLLLIV